MNFWRVLASTAIGACISLPAFANSSPDNLWGLLMQIHDQASLLSYEGTLTTRAGEENQTSRLKHYATKDGEFEFLERLDGQPAQWIRHNDYIQCVIPDRKLILSENRRTSLVFPRMMGSSNMLVNLKKYYSIMEMPPERVAGRQSRVIQLNPKDGLRYQYRLTVDKETQLLLRTESFTSSGNLLERVGFSEINFSVDSASHPKLVEAGPGWKESMSKVIDVDESHLDFTLPEYHHGFTKTQNLCRSRKDASTHREIHQTIYSDGLSSISIFVQVMDQSMTLPRGAMSHGAVTSLSERQGDYLVTALGEVPESTLKEFLALITWKKQQEGKIQ